MKWYKRWREERKKRHDKLQYTRGFQWAVASFYLDKMSVIEIESYLGSGASFTDQDYFDAGVKEAIRSVSDMWGTAE
jgi:hypothetical protein